MFHASSKRTVATGLDIRSDLPLQVVERGGKPSSFRAEQCQADALWHTEVVEGGVVLSFIDSATFENEYAPSDSSKTKLRSILWKKQRLESLPVSLGSSRIWNIEWDAFGNIKISSMLCMWTIASFVLRLPAGTSLY